MMPKVRRALPTRKHDICQCESRNHALRAGGDHTSGYGTSPAAAYICALSPKGDAIMVKTDNPSSEVKTCTVSCRFAVGQGSETITCTQQIPPGVQAWYVCLRPTNGKAFGRLESGSESCK